MDASSMSSMDRKLGSCPICLGGSVAFDFTARSGRLAKQELFDVYRCRDCDHRMLNPQPGPRRLARYYDEFYSAYERDHGLDGDRERIVESARRNGGYRHVPIREGMRILDVGTGGGSFLSIAKALGAHVEGVEPSPHGVKTCRQQGLPVFCGTLDRYLDAYGSEKTFDLVTANHVVEHHPDPVRLLSQTKEILAPSGYVWFSMPNPHSPYAAWLGDRWYSFDVPFHLMHFSEQSVRIAVERAGLMLRSLTTYSLPRSVEASILLYLKHRYGIPGRLTRRIPGFARHARRTAARMDAQRVGEAFIVEAAA